MIQAFSALIMAFSALISSPQFITNQDVQNQALALIPQIQSIGTQIETLGDQLTTSSSPISPTPPAPTSSPAPVPQPMILGGSASPETPAKIQAPNPPYSVLLTAVDDGTQTTFTAYFQEATGQKPEDYLTTSTLTIGGQTYPMNLNKWQATATLDDSALTPGKTYSAYIETSNYTDQNSATL